MTANELAALRRFCGYPVPMCDACSDATGTDCKKCNAWRHLLDVAVQQEREIADGLMAKWKETQQEMRAELARPVISDIHGGGKGGYWDGWADGVASVRTVGEQAVRERDEANWREKQLSANHATMHGMWVKATDELNKRDRRIAELEAALRETLLPLKALHLADGHNWSPAVREQFAKAEPMALAALSPAPAQPATSDLGTASIVGQLREIVTDQANDPGLWYDADRAPEAYLQRALRDLHGVVERAIAGLSPAQPATAAKEGELQDQDGTKGRDRMIEKLTGRRATVAPPSPAATAATCVCSHGRSDHNVQWGSCLVGQCLCGMFHAPSSPAECEAETGTTIQFRRDFCPVCNREISDGELTALKARGRRWDHRVDCTAADGYSSNRDPKRLAIDAAHNFMAVLATRDFLEFMHRDAAVAGRWKELSAALAHDAAREGK